MDPTPHLDDELILSGRRLRCPVCSSTVTREQGNGFVRARCSSPTCRFWQDARIPQAKRPAPASPPPAIVVTAKRVPKPVPTTKCCIPSCVGSITFAGHGRVMGLCGRHLAAWEFVDRPQGDAFKGFIDIQDELEQAADQEAQQTTQPNLERSPK